MVQFFFLLYHLYIILIRLKNKIMLRKVGWKRARVPLTQRVGYSHFMLTDESVWMKSRLIITPTMFRLSGISELALLSWHPESVLPLSLLSFMDYDCGRCGSTSYLSAKVVNQKTPRQIVRVTDEEPMMTNIYFLRYELNIPIHHDISNLSGAKLGIKSRLCKGH